MQSSNDREAFPVIIGSYVNHEDLKFPDTQLWASLQW